MNINKLILTTALAAFIFSLGGCGGGGSGGSSSTPTGAILGGTVSGLLSGQTISLSNGTQNVQLVANGTFKFADPVTSLVTVSITTGPTDGTKCEVSDANNPANSTASFGLANTSSALLASAIQITCSKFPAFSPSVALPQITSSTLGAAPIVMASPKIVPVYYLDTPYQASNTTFLQSLISSSYWSILAQYGVGAATVETPIIISTNAPTKLTSIDVQSILIANAATWAPAGSPSPIFLFYVPVTTTTNSNGPAFHSIAYAGAQAIPFSIISSQSASGGGVNRLTEHELMEAVADPDGFTGYSTLTIGAKQWGYMEGNSSAEIGDLCEWINLSNPSLSSTILQPIWSNAAAAVGLDPCQPSQSAANTFFGAVPVLSSVLTTNGSKDYGVILAGGLSVVVPVKIFSNSPMNTPIVVSASTTGVVGASIYVDPATYSFDKIYAHNGDVVNMTISTKGTYTGMYTFAVKATQGSISYSFPGAFANILNY